jgi:dinuclear metal center YbgI/SA1388 family protein
MKNIDQIASYLNQLLKIHEFKDSSLNGLQVSQGKYPVNKIAVSVDSGLSVIENAISQKANLLIVHHGLFWGQEQPITDVLAEKIKILLLNECSLYASHLPLDAHLKFGNASQLALALGLKQIKPAFKYHANTIGVIAKNSKLTINQLIKKSQSWPGNIEPLYLNFGTNKLNKIGIVTGSGSSMLHEAKKLKIDLLISGEPKHESYHLAKELKLNALFLGHYCTETFGVRAIASHLNKKFNIKTSFIDEPSGI